MSASTLLEKDRHSLTGHRLRGLPAFWIGFIALVLSLIGFMARQREVPEIRKFARGLLDPLPGGDDFLARALHFQFTAPPFATIATLVGIALLIWGAVELHAAGRIKRELLAVEDARRKQQLLEELRVEEGAPASKPKKVGKA